MATNGFITRFRRNFSKSPSYRWGAIICGIIVLFSFKKVKVWIVQEIALWRLKTANDSTTISGNSITINIKEIARNAYHAIWGGWFEDEEAFIKACLQCPREYITELATEYAKIDSKGKNIYNDAVKYLSTNQYNQVRHLFI